MWNNDNNMKREVLGCHSRNFCPEVFLVCFLFLYLFLFWNSEIIYFSLRTFKKTKLPVISSLSSNRKSHCKSITFRSHSSPSEWSLRLPSWRLILSASYISIQYVGWGFFYLPSGNDVLFLCLHSSSSTEWTEWSIQSLGWQRFVFLQKKKEEEAVRKRLKNTGSLISASSKTSNKSYSCEEGSCKDQGRDVRWGLFEVVLGKKSSLSIHGHIPERASSNCFPSIV